MKTLRCISIATAVCALALAALGPAAALAASASRWDDDSSGGRGDDAAWLGVRVQTITPELREALELRDERGALVSDVMKGSPAARAGIEKSDVIVGLDGRAIDTPTDLTDAVAAQTAGKKVRLTVIRDGEELNRDAKLESRPVQRERRRLFPPIPPRVEGTAGGGHLGVETKAMDDDLAAYFGTAGGRGVLVTGVQADSPAAAAGIRAGDVILGVDGEAIADPVELLAAVRKKGSGDEVRLEVLRQRRESEIVATLDDAPPFGGGRHRWFDSLRGSMHDLRGRMHEERVERTQDVKHEMAKLRDEMDELKRELAELKAKLR